MAQMTRDTAFKILAVARTASEKEIKRAYKVLSLQHHPDRGGDSEDFKAIKEAYECLMNRGKCHQNTGSSRTSSNESTQAKPQREIRFPVYKILGGTCCLLDFDIWNERNITTSKLCEEYAFVFFSNYMGIANNIENKKRFVNVMRRIKNSWDYLDIAGYVMPLSSKDLAVYLMGIVLMELNMRQPLCKCIGGFRTFSVTAVLFAEMKSPYRINQNMERVKRNWFERQYQKFSA